MVIITSHISGFKKTLCLNGEQSYTQNDIYQYLQRIEGNIKDIILYRSSRPIGEADLIHKNDLLTANIRLRGGKGGFGSMLRAIGAQIEKTTNREACRDLSGRRLRDINEEKRLKDMLARKAEKEKEHLENRKKALEKLKETPKHMFEDKQYFEQKEKKEKDLQEALMKGMKKNPNKRSLEESRTSVKKLRLFDDSDFDSDSSDEEESSKLPKKNSGNSVSENSNEINKELNIVSSSICSAEESKIKEDNLKM